MFRELQFCKRQATTAIGFGVVLVLGVFLGCGGEKGLTDETFENSTSDVEPIFSHGSSDRILEIPYKISVPEAVEVPDWVPLLPGRVLPNRLVLPEGVTLPEVELDMPENVRQSPPENGIQLLGTIPAQEVRIFATFQQHQQWVRFGVNFSANFVGHCRLPTWTPNHGSAEQWDWNLDVQNNTARLLVPTSLYWIYIYPQYLVSFLNGLIVDLAYNNPSNWWATY